MNRELKFRVWDKEQKKFEYFELHNITVPDRLLIQDRFPVQQFTGLKDSEGKEIYEGDHVEYYKDRKNYLGTVTFFEGAYTVIGEHYYENNELTIFKYQLYNLYKYIFEYKVKVVGNIFQLPCNPDHNGECLVCDEWLSDCPFNKEK